MTYILQNNVFNVRGIITAAQVNALGSTPFVFETPANFIPVGFVLTPNSGTTQPIFSSPLVVITVSSSRVVFVGTDPANVDFSTLFGLSANSLGPVTFVEATNIELTQNNFSLTPEDFTDPTPGDYEYRYILFGFIF